MSQGFRPPKDLPPPPRRGEIPSDLALPGSGSRPLLGISPPPPPPPLNFRDFALLRFQSSYYWGQKERREDRPLISIMLQLLEML